MNPSHGYTEGADAPENLLPIREEPERCNHNWQMDIDGYLRCTWCYAREVKITLKKKEDQPAKPEPTRKLVFDELIEWLNNESGFGSMDIPSIDVLSKAQSLRKKEEENTPKWISVKDRLPEERIQSVLLFNGDAPNYNQHIFRGVWFSQTQTFTRDADDYPLMGTITHWMQLPPHPNI
jgi:hypothetical protein